MRKQKIVKNGLGVTLIFSLVITTGGILFSNNVQAEEINKKFVNDEYIKRTNHIDTLLKQHEYDQRQEEIEKAKQKPEYQISLSREYKNLIWELCNENNLSYELVLAIVYQESQFNVDAVNYNRNKTVDKGLFQINSYHLKDYEQYARIYGDLPNDIEFNVSNPIHNIRAGIGGLTYFREIYKNKGVDEESLVYYVLGSYHAGKDGYENYVSRNNYLENEYANKVLESKYNLEQNGVLE